MEKLKKCKSLFSHGDVKSMENNLDCSIDVNGLSAFVYIHYTVVECQGGSC